MEQNTITLIEIPKNLLQYSVDLTFDNFVTKHVLINTQKLTLQSMIRRDLVQMNSTLPLSFSSLKYETGYKPYGLKYIFKRL